MATTKFGDDRDMETVVASWLIIRDMEFYQIGLNITYMARTVFKNTGIVVQLNLSCSYRTFKNPQHLHCISSDRF